MSLCKVTATIGMLINQTFEFDSFEEASQFGESLIMGRPVGTVEVLNAQGAKAWSYCRTRP